MYVITFFYGFEILQKNVIYCDSDHWVAQCTFLFLYELKYCCRPPSIPITLRNLLPNSYIISGFIYLDNLIESFWLIWCTCRVLLMGNRFRNVNLASNDTNDHHASLRLVAFRNCLAYQPTNPNPLTFETIETRSTTSPTMASVFELEMYLDLLSLSRISLIGYSHNSS